MKYKKVTTFYSEPSVGLSSPSRCYTRRCSPAKASFDPAPRTPFKHQHQQQEKESFDDEDKLKHLQDKREHSLQRFGDGLHHEVASAPALHKVGINGGPRLRRLVTEREKALQMNDSDPTQRFMDRVHLNNSCSSSDEMEKDLEKVPEEEKGTGGKQRGVYRKNKRMRASERVRSRVSDSEKGPSRSSLSNGDSCIQSNGIGVDRAVPGSGRSSDDSGLCQKRHKRGSRLSETESLSRHLGVQGLDATCSTIQQEGREAGSNECSHVHSDHQDFMATMSRGGITELDRSENIENGNTPVPRTPEAETCSRQDILLKEEGCNHDISPLNTRVAWLADTRASLSPVMVGNSRDQQSELNTRQDKETSETEHCIHDVIPSQNFEQGQPILSSPEDMKTKFEDLLGDVPHTIQFGEVKHFYKRRRKRILEECSAAPNLDSNRPSLNLVESEVLQKMQSGCSAAPNLDRNRPNLDLVESKVQMMQSECSVALNLDSNRLSFDLVESEVLQKTQSGCSAAPNLGNHRPSLDLVESELPQKVQSDKSTSQAKKALRWSRELMMLVADGYSFNEESTGMDGDVPNGSVLPARKRRRLQKNSNFRNTASEIVVVSDGTGQIATPLPKEAQQKWRDVDLSSTDPTQLIGCKCKVYWPDDKDWYTGVVTGYNIDAGIHHVDYDDGDKEDLVLAKELVKLYLSENELIARNIPSNCETVERKRLDFQEMAALATVFEDFQEEFRHGELIWAKIKGHPMWPAFVMDEKHADAWGLDAPVRESTLAVQFFGSYDYARISSKQAVPFSKGLLLKLYGKCKKATFDQGLKEAERYLKEGKLPDIMSKLQDEALDSTVNASQLDMSEEDQDFMGDERTHKTKKSVQSLLTCPIKLGDLQVLSLGKIVRDSEHFHNENQIWTEGYTAIRKFPSIKDPEKHVDYRMEIIKDPEDRTKPLFCVTSVDGEVVEGSTPSICWKKVFQKVEKAKEKLGALGLQFEKKRQQASAGDLMFGFTNPQILKLIQALPYARVCFKFTGWFDKRATENFEQFMPAGFKPVEVDWKHADRCSVCDLDEEYTNNLFLQCDRCRILVHMHCYGESERPNGHLWLCQLCRPEESAQNSLCCLCPVQGGAMKRTTDGRWAHLTCAMWIPETCFVDVKHMEPIDGLKSINKERWKLTCSICKVPYGVCIQCSEPSCYAAYHVLCARSSGFALEVSEDSSHKPRDGAEDFDEPVRFLSYCKKHRQSKIEKGTLAQRIASSKQELGYSPPENSSGCARTEPYNGATRRGRQEPEVRAAAAAKRHYVKKMPYLVSGFCRQDRCESDIAHKFALFSSQARNLQTRKVSLGGGDNNTLTPKGTENETTAVVTEDSSSISSVSDRYQEMRLSLKHRLTFGKSPIHGWGVFTKRSHRAGDMVIEYAGEVVRPIVADLRERLIYNTLVGAGTYMFRIDDERVVDATCEGSIAHLINHSCEPNCFSRVVTISDEEHIIIFAKRDIEEGEELSYDYRFTSKGEQLECFCGAPSCRGFVNVSDADEETSRILVPRREITAWTPLAS